MLEPDVIDVTVQRDGDCTVVRIAGDVCIVTAPVLRLALEGAIDSGTRSLIVDLSTTTLLAAAGVGQLVWANRRTNLRIRGASPLATRVLDLCGLGDRLEISPDSRDGAHGRERHEHEGRHPPDHGDVDDAQQRGAARLRDAGHRYCASVAPRPTGSGER